LPPLIKAVKHPATNVIWLVFRGDVIGQTQFRMARLVVVRLGAFGNFQRGGEDKFALHQVG